MAAGDGSGRHHLLLDQGMAKRRIGLTSQIRRSATSIPANIAEGYGRDNRGSYQQFLRIAQGSLKEFETHLEIAERIGLATHDQAYHVPLATEGIGKMLRQLISKLAPE